MSFSSQVKSELCTAPITCKHCFEAQSYGMLLFAQDFSRKKISLQTEHPKVKDAYINLLEKLCGHAVNRQEYTAGNRKGKKLYSVSVDSSIERDYILQKFKHSFHSNRIIIGENIKNDCCRTAFLRGAFMVCGSVTNPEKEYHLEFFIPDAGLAMPLEKFLQSCGISIKTTKRKEHQVLYLKESENIEDILTLMGAVESSLEIMGVKIVKDVRNKANRVTNCETANIDKTVVASYNQIQELNIIQEKAGLNSLPDNLKEIAYARLENPEASLNELAVILGGHISRSGIYHRFKKISSIAKELNKNTDIRNETDE